MSQREGATDQPPDLVSGDIARAGGDDIGARADQEVGCADSSPAARASPRIAEADLRQKAEHQEAKSASLSTAGPCGDRAP